MNVGNSNRNDHLERSRKISDFFEHRLLGKVCIVLNTRSTEWLSCNQISSATIIIVKIAVLVSGGVDSSVALALLKEAGYDISAFYLKIWLEDEVSHLGDCAWEADLEYVEKTCKQLAVPLQVISLQREYWDTVVTETIAEVKQGLTPNPDIWCNEKVKFGSVYQKIPAEFTKVATGHYAQVEKKGEKFWLKSAPDAVKDQAYFLSRLTQAQLARAMFPIGHLQKDEVREVATNWKLPSRNRPDSQGICFLGKFKFSDFLRAHVGVQVGEIIDIDANKVIGEHDGFWFYTIGQRQGLGLSGGPWYVVGKNTAENQIFVSGRLPNELGVTSFEIVACNWIPEAPDDRSYRIKLRHGPSFNMGSLQILDNDRAHITLEKTDANLAPGQSAVLYKNGYCLGGGIVA